MPYVVRDKTGFIDVLENEEDAFDLMSIDPKGRLMYEEELNPNQTVVDLFGCWKRSQLLPDLGAQDLIDDPDHVLTVDQHLFLMNFQHLHLIVDEFTSGPPRFDDEGNEL